MVSSSKKFKLVSVEQTDKLFDSEENDAQVFMYNNRLAINVEEFADLMGIGRENAMRLIERKKEPVPHKRVGNRIIISFPALIKWLESWSGD